MTYSISLIISYLMFYCVQLADRVSVYSVDIVSVDALDYIDTFRKQTRFVHCHLKVRSQ